VVDKERARERGRWVASGGGRERARTPQEPTQRHCRSWHNAPICLHVGVAHSHIAAVTLGNFATGAAGPGARFQGVRRALRGTTRASTPSVHRATRKPIMNTHRASTCRGWRCWRTASPIRADTSGCGSCVGSWCAPARCACSSSRAGVDGGRRSAGAGRHELRDAGGWSSGRMADRYTHARMERLRELIGGNGPATFSDHEKKAGDPE
jgi:hypothetical protein